MRRFIIIPLLGIFLSSIQAAPASASDCIDRADEEVCLIDEGPYLPAEVVRFTMPAHAQKVSVNASQQGQPVDKVWAVLVTAGEPGGYDTWSFVMTPRYQTGGLIMDFRSDKGDSGIFSEYATQPARNLAVTATSRRAIFTGTAERTVKAKVVSRVQARNAGSWRTTSRRTETALFEAGSFKLTSDSAPRSACEGYKYCRIVTEGTVYTQAVDGGPWYKSKDKKKQVTQIK